MEPFFLIIATKNEIRLTKFGKMEASFLMMLPKKPNMATLKVIKDFLLP